VYGRRLGALVRVFESGDLLGEIGRHEGLVGGAQSRKKSSELVGIEHARVHHLDNGHGVGARRQR